MGGTIKPIFFVKWRHRRKKRRNSLKILVLKRRLVSLPYDRHVQEASNHYSRWEPLSLGASFSLSLSLSLSIMACRIVNLHLSELKDALAGSGTFIHQLRSKSPTIHTRTVLSKRHVDLLETKTVECCWVFSYHKQHVSVTSAGILRSKRGNLITKRLWNE